MTIEEIKKALQSQLVSIEMNQGSEISLRYVLMLIDELDKLNPKASVDKAPKPKTLKVVIDSKTGNIRQYKSGEDIWDNQIVDLLISPVSGAKAEEPPTLADVYKTAPTPPWPIDAAIDAAVQELQRFKGQPTHIGYSAAETYRTLQPEVQRLFLNNPMTGIVYPSGLVNGNRVQVITTEGHILTGLVSEFSWSDSSRNLLVKYYRKV